MLDKKQIQVIFLFEFKIGPKAAETTHNINNTFDQGTDNLYYSAVSGSRSFAKESLEDEECGGQHHKLTMTNWEDNQSRSSYNYNYTRRCQRTQCYQLLAFEANWKGEKAR